MKIRGKKGELVISLCRNKKTTRLDDTRTFKGSERFTGLSVVNRDFPSIETVENKRSISFRSAPPISKLPTAVVILVVFSASTYTARPAIALSNEILPEPVKPTKTQGDTIANIDVYPFNS